VVKDLSGTWKKEFVSSDSMDRAAEVMQLPWVIKKALPLASTLQISHEAEGHDAHFATTLKAGPLDVAERYQLNGVAAQFPRRDRRSGKHSAVASGGPAQPVTVQGSWEEPLGGRFLETFDIRGQQLVVTTTLSTNSGDKCTYKTVYNRHLQN
jgi:hypothetical protein